MSSSNPRYRFAGFVLSPSRRVLLHEGAEVPLIPRYFDLLVLLLERREEAVSRREILDSVWNDVVVTDNALNQAVRILRRTLGDASRSPVFIRTVSRHGYRFVHPGVAEDPDDTPLLGPAEPESPPDQACPGTEPPVRPDEPDDPFGPALRELLSPGPHPADDDGRREAAERLHVLGTFETLRRLDRRPGHESARAFLRDTRWDVPGAGRVPILGQPSPVRTTIALVALRLRRVLRLAGRRWVAAASGGAAAGAIAGVLGGIVLRYGPGSTATHAVFVALPLVGVIAGGLGAAGVGAGLAAAEAVIRSFRGTALVLMGAVGGGVVGALVNLVGRLVLESLFGRDPSPLALTLAHT